MDLNIRTFYRCPVCGYPGLDEPPYDTFGCSSFDICSCCGFQFGVDDDDHDENNEPIIYSKEELYTHYRNAWIASGAKPISEDFPERLLKTNGSLKDHILKDQLKSMTKEPLS
ncbi:hypothetical protein [Alkalicoccobacillus gibsonii]|uniref:hypothetical protein n=1 Tax=Alkalicoccobacillus gibsonii TaxID=79881 RepID=UPI001931296C|nr:hypothetical protein [Alkalicoccobacillus gibsonii]MBM0065910.1 hypothetical protein [Alkalicoccobacillus gibsonii]